MVRTVPSEPANRAAGSKEKLLAVRDAAGSPRDREAITHVYAHRLSGIVQSSPINSYLTPGRSCESRNFSEMARPAMIGCRTSRTMLGIATGSRHPHGALDEQWQRLFEQFHDISISQPG